MILPKPYQVKVLDNIVLTTRVRKIILELLDPGKLIFLAGQFLMFDIGGGIKRAYSISSIPMEDQRLELLIDLFPNGPASLYFKQVKPETIAVITAPYGRFTIRENAMDKIFIAASTGVAPMRSMIRSFLREKESLPSLTLYFGVNKVEELFLVEEFRELEAQYPNFKYCPVVSMPESEWNGEVGMVTAPLLRDVSVFGDKDIYICGSPKMVPVVRQVLLEKGADPGHLYNEGY